MVILGGNYDFLHRALRAAFSYLHDFGNGTTGFDPRDRMADINADFIVGIMNSVLPDRREVYAVSDTMSESWFLIHYHNGSRIYEAGRFFVLYSSSMHRCIYLRTRLVGVELNPGPISFEDVLNEYDACDWPHYTTMEWKENMRNVLRDGGKLRCPECKGKLRELS